MSDPIETLPNLGPFTARCLAEIDVTTVSALRRLGSVEAFARLKFRFGREISLNALWAMDAGLAGLHWRDIGVERKAELKALLAARLPATDEARPKASPPRWDRRKN